MRKRHSLWLRAHLLSAVNNQLTSHAREVKKHVLNEFMGLISCQIESIKAEFQRCSTFSPAVLRGDPGDEPAVCALRREYLMTQIHPLVIAHTFAWRLFHQFESNTNVNLPIVGGWNPSLAAFLPCKVLMEGCTCDFPHSILHCFIKTGVMILADSLVLIWCEHFFHCSNLWLWLRYFWGLSWYLLPSSFFYPEY